MRKYIDSKEKKDEKVMITVCLLFALLVVAGGIYYLINGFDGTENASLTSINAASISDSDVPLAADQNSSEADGQAGAVSSDGGAFLPLDASSETSRASVQSSGNQSSQSAVGSGNASQSSSSESGSSQSSFSQSSSSQSSSSESSSSESSFSQSSSSQSSSSESSSSESSSSESSSSESSSSESSSSESSSSESSSSQSSSSQGSSSQSSSSQSSQSAQIAWNLSDIKGTAKNLYVAFAEFWRTEKLLSGTTDRALGNRCGDRFGNGSFVNCLGGNRTNDSGVEGYDIGKDFLEYIDVNPTNFKIYMTEQDPVTGLRELSYVTYKVGSTMVSYDGSKYVTTINGVVQLSPLGNSFQEISSRMISLIVSRFNTVGSYGRTFGDYTYTDIGLNPEDWANPIGHIYYWPGGSKLNVRPETGYSFIVEDLSGNTKTIKSSYHWNLVYDVVSGKWYYHTIAEGNEINIETFRVELTQ